MPLSTKPIRPELVIAMSAVLWGLFWIPIRALEDQGLEPALIAVSQFIAPVIFLLPFGLKRLTRKKSIGFEQYYSGLLIGAGFALYCESILLTDVVRALILFYVMPAWATLIEVLILKRRFTWRRGVALGLSLGGMIAILNIDASFSLVLNLGDVMALASGICVAFGATRIRQSPNTDVFPQVFAFFVYGALISLLFLLIPATAPKTMLGIDVLWRLLPWIALMSIVYLLPIMWGLYWGSKSVDPGRLGILLQIEVIVGIGSAALLTDEPFGIREFIGALLVISAGLVEVLSNTQPKTSKD